MQRIVSYLLAVALATVPVVATQLFFGLSDGYAACVNGVLSPGAGEDLEVTGPCTVNEGQTYNYGNVNIYNGGSLTFADPSPGKEIHFWAQSILVEKDSYLPEAIRHRPLARNARLPKKGRIGLLWRTSNVSLVRRRPGRFSFRDQSGQGGERDHLQNGRTLRCARNQVVVQRRNKV